MKPNTTSLNSALFLSFAALTVLGSGCGPSQQDPVAATAAIVNAQLTTPSSFAELSEADGGGQMIVRCQLDNNSEFCLVDTGSPISRVNGQNTDLQQYPSLGGGMTGGIDGNGRVRDDFINVGQLSVLGMSLPNVRFVRESSMDFPSSLSSKGIDGSIGNDIFSFYAMFFDFQNRQIVFNQSAPDNLTQQPLIVMPSRHAAMSISVNGIATTGLWDTGSFITLVDPSLIQAQPSQFTYLSTTHSGVQDATGRNLDMTLYQAQNITIGSATFSNITVGAVPLDQLNRHLANPVGAIIGYNVISQASWYLDFPNQLWSVTQ
jgi:hypothetical protein